MEWSRFAREASRIGFSWPNTALTFAIPERTIRSGWPARRSPQPKWWLHGLLLGLILTLVPAFGVLWARMAWANEFVHVLVAGLLTGILVEFFTTVIFKATAGIPPA